MTPQGFLNAEYPCINQLLAELHHRSGANSVAVVHQEGRVWRADFEMPAAARIGDLASRAGPSLESGTRAAVPWWPFRIENDPSWLLAIPVVFQIGRASCRERV